MTRRARKILTWILVYLVVGYFVNVSVFFLSNPGYLRPCPIDRVAAFKCPPSPWTLVAEMMATPHFWLGILIWPFVLVAYHGAR